MEVRECGRTGLKLSMLGLGCWAFGGGDYWGPQDQSEVDAVVRRAFELGVNYFDTAEVYNEGRSESSLGRALLSLPRARVVIGTKVSPAHVQPATLPRRCEASLRRLATDYIDLYMVHWPVTPRSIRHFDADASVCPAVDDAFATLVRLRDEGKVRHIGVSNHSLLRLDEARRHCPDLVANELPYNLLARAIDLEVLPGCVERGVGAIGYMPLAQGVLTDRYPTLADVPRWRRRTRHFDAAGAPDARHGLRGEEEATRKALRELRALSLDLGLPLSELALSWTLANPGLVCSLVGSRTVAQVEANLRTVERPLAPDVVARLNEITRPLKERLGRSFDYYESPENDRTS
jgi:aryl-alcohol dehydrogenase-like predicted oxidoreductase